MNSYLQSGNASPQMFGCIQDSAKCHGAREVPILISLRSFTWLIAGFWPTSGDYVKELEKCERILRMFTVEGVPTEETSKDGKKKRKVFRKLPPNIIKEAKGLIIFTAMRTGFAPFAGAGEPLVAIPSRHGNSC